MNKINNTFLKLSKRAETNDIDYLVKTFVNNGPLFTILSNKDHEILYGRRGTGKTHALAYLSDSLNLKNEIIVTIDLRTIGSNGGIFSDNTIPIKERATRLLIDTFSFIIDSIIDTVINNNTGKYNLAKVSPIADLLWDSVTQIVVDGGIEIAEKSTTNDSTSQQSKFGVDVGTDKFSASSSTGKDKKSDASTEIYTKQEGKQYHRINFSSVYKHLQTLSQELNTHIWIIFDEWAEVPQDLQPFLAELIRRTILPNTGITVKIAAIEQRTNLLYIDGVGNRIGVEIGADIAASQNLDEYMVFDNDEERAKVFFTELLYHHFVNIAETELLEETGINEAQKLINLAFTQVNAFSEFVRASEGIARDAINILGIAAIKANDNKISIENVRAAARIWYTRGKEKSISTHEKALNLLQWIIDEVIGKRNARAFLLQTNQRDPLIDYLFDARVLHIIKENVSGKDTPGLRYNVYSIDYGCYVELINTANAPKGLFEALADDEEEAGEIFVDVPKNDYRAIRRAILDLSEFYKEVV
ncbi:hypothetical protein FLJC2902T_23960 [Flavobacterium limnosediminis JC2902]|uniref:Uncharacterized protein n=1 Tax=Flavobacterium limnosediminis JC2902 TaxID=1341181 RepID=V6SKS7_9FLAO|nr:hypothetical protein [Flavobacterium limnosediminis]ESU27054.1 hypothetical protein FLJC2902T_23960 [Flavobacterium limnosediminis JC2902]